MLTEAHAKHLAQFRISAETLETGGICSVSDSDARELLGINGRASLDLSGIYFPYFHPLEDRRVGSSVRLDNPIEEMKYIEEQGSRHFFFPRGLSKKWFQDTSTPVVFVEAVKSALALSSLAQRINQRMIPIAIGGCSAWKRKSGKNLKPDGSTEYTTGPGPDFDLIAWNGRTAVVLFDANVLTNISVGWEQQKLTNHLLKLGANVLWLHIPILPGINGPDDLIQIRTDEEAAKWLATAEAYKEPPRENKQKEETQAVEMVNATADLVKLLFHSGDHEETWPISGRAFKRFLSHRYYQEKKRAPSSEAVRSAIQLLEGQACFEGPEQKTFVRIAEHDGAIWLDLANDKWQAVRITKDGWTVVDKPSVRFLRPRGLESLPLPERGGSINELRPFLSLESDNDFILAVSWLVACTRPRGPYPVLVIVSEHGSGKTTMSRILRKLIDPNFAPTRAEPKENRDLAIACRNGHVVALDNISGLQDWLSDTLSRISTGDGFATRMLHTDVEEVLFAACRPILINGITATPHRPDLLDRSVIVKCEQIPESLRRDEDELWAQFGLAQPRILGALLDAAVKALDRIGDIKLPALPRMADFAKWTVSAEPALPWLEGKFMEIYSTNRLDAIGDILQDDPVADLARSIADWEGTATEFLAELNLRNPRLSERKDWYKKPRQVSDRLKRLVPALRKSEGIVVVWHRDKNRRTISIQRVGEAKRIGGITSSPSPASPDEPFQQLSGDDVGDGGDESTGGDDRDEPVNDDLFDRHHVTTTKQRDGDDGDGSDDVSPTTIYPD